MDGRTKQGASHLPFFREEDFICVEGRERHDLGLASCLPSKEIHFPHVKWRGLHFSAVSGCLRR